MKKIYWLVPLIIILVAGAIFIYWHSHRSTQSAPTATNASTTQPSSTATAPTSASVSPVAAPNNPNNLDYPIAQFASRITKKPFGIYVTPASSPVQPERFTGYHTGTDIEYQDVVSDVPVYAVAAGTVVLAETASGYGGVFMIEIDGAPSTPLGTGPHTVLYGHIRPSSLPKVGQQVSKGEQLAVLGTGYSAQTDGERRHLHFAVLSDNRLDIKGYVQSKSALSGWIDPVTLYQ